MNIMMNKNEIYLEEEKTFLFRSNLATKVNLLRPVQIGMRAASANNFLFCVGLSLTITDYLTIKIPKNPIIIITSMNFLNYIGVCIYAYPTSL